MRSKVLAGRFLALTVLLSLATMAAAQASQTTTEVARGAATAETSELKGEVEYVEGNSLVVTMSSGELRTFTVPESRKFLIDGKELSVHELKPGTKLTATVTTTMTPVRVRTVTVKSGTVWHVLGNNVILTLPNGENKQFTVNDDTRLIVNDKPATARDLSKGMVVYAEKVVEEPMTEITTDTTVVGQAPAPAAAPAAAPAPAVAQVPAAEPPPAPAEQAPAPAKAASRTPLIVGLLLVAGILVVWVLLRRKSGEVRG